MSGRSAWCCIVVLWALHLSTGAQAGQHHSVDVKAELRTKQLLSNIRSHLAKQVEEVVLQKECDSGLILCDSQKEKEDSPEASDEEPPPPKIRGHHKPLIKVNPKDVIQTMIHKVHKVHAKPIEHETLKVKKLKVSEEAEDDEDDNDSKEDSEEEEESKQLKSDKKSKKARKADKEASSEKKDDKEGGDEGDDEDEEGIRFPKDIPVFAATSSAVENALCRKHSRLFQRQLERYKMWALLMYDSSAKMPSGILQGNVNQLGDFDQCLSVNAVLKDKSNAGRKGASQGIQGRYCLASIDVEATAREGALEQALKKAEAYGVIRSNAKDPGYFVPRFTTINWGLCVPSSCSGEDVANALADELAVYNETAGLAFTVVVDDASCVDRQDLHEFSLSIGTCVTMVFYLAVVSATGYATYRDAYGKTEVTELEAEKGSPDEEKGEEAESKMEDGDGEKVPQLEGNSSAEEEPAPPKQGRMSRLIMAFSLKRCSEELLSEPTNAGDEISCIHGIKAIFTLLLYVAHKLSPLGFTPYYNRLQLTKLSNNAGSTILRTSIIYTDSFLLVSGVLTAYNITQQVIATGKVGWLRRTLSRFIRLTPPLLAVVLFYGFVSEHLGSGPMWAPIVGKNAEICRENGWMNLLYIQNLFDFQEMCAPQTHQLALDMQLSLLAPLFVYVLYAYDLLGLLVLQFIFLLSAALRYITTSNNQLTLVFYHGVPSSQLYDTANLMYAQAIYRATPYVLGVTLGFYLKKRGNEIQEKLQRPLAAIGWIISACLALLSILSPAHLADRNYQYDVQEAAQYAALSPIAWSLALGWVIAACHLGYGGRLNRLLSSWPLLVLSRISYSVYLIQFLVFNHNVGVIRAPKSFSFFDALDLPEVVTTLILGTLLTLVLDIPIKEVKSVIVELLSDSSYREDAVDENKEEADKTAEKEKEDGEEGERSKVIEDDSQLDNADSAPITIKQSEKEEEDPPVRYPPDYEEDEELEEEEPELEEEEEEEAVNLRRSSRVRFDEGDDKEFWVEEDVHDEEELEERETQEDNGNFWGVDED